ncbi:PPE family protein [Mycolicibacter sp. MYC123]|uniref:PPE family protein n=2 Tax=Mycolicibacter TaxID=1073531 RepID=A0ABU5YK56_9MYCO|nr:MULTISPECIES: PPE family protein [unclassified Mycolicibacter]MEB3050170.1 PPE family protein [Mycolicibacter sp. MYC123]MEB3063705.1 PPE family protein [Mycolicibacter sp. MYC101]MEB3069453.1 PPE family protein [Mycolicibacter sp. MYC017]
MDFAALPPEVNSGRMYAGPGSGPMLAAATAWARLAAETGSAAKAYQSVLTGLTDEGWLGPTSESMAAAVSPYVAWLQGTAGLAEQAAARATAAAAAFDEAYSAVAPPPVIAANRSAQAALVATNLLGQNSAEIAALDAGYAQLWVQDAVAMYGYAARSAAATALTTFTEPPATTNPSGTAGQAAAVAQAGGHSELSQLISAIPQALQGLGSAAASVAPSAAAPAAPLTLTQLVSYLLILPKSIVPFNDALKSVLYGMIQYARNLNTDLDIAAATGGRAGFGSGAAALVAADDTALLGARPMSAGVGNAAAIGRLSVPSNWTATAPVAKMAAAVLPEAGAAAAAAAGAQIPTGVFGDLAVAGLAGRALTGAAPRSHPAAAMNGHAQGRLERLVTELAGTTEVQHWHVDPSRLDSLLEELAEQPGVHAVHVNPDGQQPSGPAPQPG